MPSKVNAIGKLLKKDSFRVLGYSAVIEDSAFVGKTTIFLKFN